ncbi:MAG: hypothetical protein ACXVBU_14380 [Ktedonobacteraceae bacterium]
MHNGLTVNQHLDFFRAAYGIRNLRCAEELIERELDARRFSLEYLCIFLRIVEHMLFLARVLPPTP